MSNDKTADKRFRTGRVLLAGLELKIKTDDADRFGDSTTEYDAV